MSNLNEEKGASAAPVTKSEIAAIDAETKQLELLSAKLRIREQEANLQDLEERLSERELKRETKRQRSLTNGYTLKALQTDAEKAQKRCNHRKGGNGLHGIVGGQGDDNQYAVLKHTFGNGDMWVRCLRCAKTWKPPIRESYESEVKFVAAVAEYTAAINFTTRNVPSGAVQFRFSDNGDYYRQVTSNTNLR